MAFTDFYSESGDDLFASHGEVMAGLEPFQASDFTAINSSPAFQNLATVSPQDLFNPSFPTPESGCFDSPMMGSSAYNTTPLEDGGFMDESIENDSFRMPLFSADQSDQYRSTAMSRVHSQSFSQSGSGSPMVRQRSGPGNSPTSRPGTAHSRKHSLVGGVSKPSKPRKALPEIVINEDDAKEIAKRKKNTAAARKSRANRADRMEQLESTVDTLRAYILSTGVDPDEVLQIKE